MSRDISNVGRWSLLRDVLASAADTALTNYTPDDLTATVKRKMVGIAPATMIAVRAWGLGADGNSAEVRISGWMDPEKDPGPGQLLLDATFTLGGHVFSIPKALSTSEAIENRVVAPITQTWREVDAWTVAAEASAAIKISTAGVAAGDDMGLLLIPTLGYTHLLTEVDSFTTAVRIILLYREVVRGTIVQTL